MSTAPVSPFVLVGDPTAAACKGDFCTVPEGREPVVVPEVAERVSVASEVDAEGQALRRALAKSGAAWSGPFTSTPR